MAQWLDQPAGPLDTDAARGTGTPVAPPTGWAPPAREHSPQTSAGHRRAATPRGAKRLADLSGGRGKGYPHP